MDKAGVARERYRMWAGYVPHCFVEVPPDLRFSFAILDVDHYQPTVEALQWLAPRINCGGILALDDYVPGCGGLASKAIDEFLARDRLFRKIAEFNHQLILQKPV
jgi:predicted O-methyltransferase YrrM